MLAYVNQTINFSLQISLKSYSSSVLNLTMTQSQKVLNSAVELPSFYFIHSAIHLPTYPLTIKFLQTAKVLDLKN